MAFVAFPSSLLPRPAVPVPRWPRPAQALRGSTARRAAATWSWPRQLRHSHAGGEELLTGLRERGYVHVDIDYAEEAVLVEALEEFAGRSSFRFPPIPGTATASTPVTMPRPFSRCFDLLYSVACTAALVMEGRGRRPPKAAPCGEDGRGPFERKGGPWPYSSSFFNIFNYDHGCLNSHVDRGVLTVVYGQRMGSENPEATRLWIREPIADEARWVAPSSGQLLLWAGEGFQSAPAVEHSVRVRPDGPYVEHSHSRPDPEAPATGNRRSVALVLDE
mmetsp:Transcript_53819/g.111799  ORF Transcript_53819/g.111799 Transcript_53819/m.111799 type:complete len:276 (-) Transcript_53819:31-858(-)